MPSVPAGRVLRRPEVLERDDFGPDGLFPAPLEMSLEGRVSFSAGLHWRFKKPGEQPINSARSGKLASVLKGAVRGANARQCGYKVPDQRLRNLLSAARLTLRLCDPW